MKQHCFGEGGGGAGGRLTSLLCVYRIKERRIVQSRYLDVRVSNIRSTKLSGASFFFAVWVKLGCSQDRYWFPLIAESERFLALQSLFVSGLNREHDGNRLINHALCERDSRNITPLKDRNVLQCFKKVTTLAELKFIRSFFRSFIYQRFRIVTFTHTILKQLQSTLALRTPRYYGYPANTDSCKIPIRKFL